MSRIITCILALLDIIVSVNGQSSNYFNVGHDLHVINEAVYSVLTTDSGYVASVSYSDTAAPVGIEFLRLDDFGNVTFSATISAPGKRYYPGYCNSLTRVPTGGYALAGSYIDSLLPVMLLVRYDEWGDTLWTMKYPSPVSAAGNQCKTTSDGGFVLVGSTIDFDPLVDVIVIRTDSLGNELWRKYYGGNNSDFGISIITTPDNGFLIGSESNSFGGDYDSYVIKTDSLGTVEWTKILGGNLDETGPQLAVDYAGNYIVGSNYTYLQPFGPGQGDPSSKLAVAKLDPNGNLLWQRTYGATKLQTAVRAIRVEDDNSISCSGGTTVANYSLATLLQLTPNGDSIRMRTYRLGLNQVNYSNAMDSAADGGYIMAGLTQTQNNAQCWFVKVDSLLCDVAGCDAVGIDESNAEEIIPVVVNVFPNPTNDVVNIKTNIPINNGILTIMNYLGQTIIEIESNSDLITLNTSSLPMGFYLFVLKNSEVTITGNFRVVH